MNLSQILQSIADFMFARLNALKTKLLSVETVANAATSAITTIQGVITNIQGTLTTLTNSVTTLTQTLTAGLANRYTKTETDSAIDGKITSAIVTITDEYTAADQIILSQAIAAARANVRKDFHKAIVDGATAVSIGDITGGVTLEDGVYQIFFHGASTATQPAMLYNESGVVGSQTVSNGDIYYFTVSGGAGAITSGVFVNDEDNVRFNLITTEQATQDARLDALESGLSGLDFSDFATHSEVDSKVLAAFTELKNDLYNSTAYSDPN